MNRKWPGQEKGMRWPDENRTEVAHRYANAASRMKRELQARGEVERGSLGELNPWKSRGRVKEIVGWMGGFDSAGTMLEEWPAMRPFVRVVQTEGRERVVGGPPPEWMRAWLPMVSIWEAERQDRERMGQFWGKDGIGRVLGQAKLVYAAGRLAEAVEREAPLLRYLKGRGGA
jgi:hypothetical protein